MFLYREIIIAGEEKIDFSHPLHIFFFSIDKILVQFSFLELISQKKKNYRYRNESYILS